jgi:N-acetylglucosamine-6-phosphate deacetylase
MKVVANARIVQPDRVLAGWLRVVDGRITEVAAGAPPDAWADVSGVDSGPGGDPGDDLGGRLIVPGFVDMHVHGGAGGSYPSGDLAEARLAHAHHLRHGTTTTLASLVTAGLPELTGAIGGLASLCEEGLFAGIHLEGPYLARTRCGAHDPDQLREPDRANWPRCSTRAAATYAWSRSRRSCAAPTAGRAAST